MTPTRNGIIENADHRILIVDDEEIVLVALRETLRREGYEVVTALNAVQALEILQRAQFSVIITDQQMPALTGLEFLAQVKRMQPDTTRILITAVLSLGTVIDAINKGEIYRFVVKPWLREELLVTVKNAAQMLEVARNFDGQLTASLHLDEADTALGQSLMPILERKAGRILANGFPTGVEVVDAQVHGGPYPASTNFGATSVGTLSIRRWLRPVAYQNLPEALLPVDLR